MPDYADLELNINRLEGETYDVDFRLRLPDSETDSQPGQGQASLNQEALRQLSLDPKQYGQQLTNDLFADSGVKSAFLKSRAAVQAQDLSLRLRLFIGPSALELHSLHWETLHDPETGELLFTGENLLFSRYLTSQDARPVRLRPKGALSALIVIASPVDLESYDLAPINAPEELARAQQALGTIPSSVLSSDKEPVTLSKLAEALRTNEPDILYLICHGMSRQGETWLFLQDDQGNTGRTAGADIINRIKELRQRPGLVVLASCQSASDSGAGVMAALGPRLAEAGVPAVIAMQGKISMQTISGMMPAFFSELQRDGQIDRAMAVARGKMRGQPDFWMPALFMRLRSGRIWYVPGFKVAFKKWPVLLSNIQEGQCTPILGSGLSDFLLGSQREIAQRWAETFHYPMFTHEREALPQVAQYLAIEQQQPSFPRSELTRYLRLELQERFRQALTPDLQKPTTKLDDLIQAAHAWIRQQGLTDAFEVLASLPLPVFITTNLHTLLESALKEAGKDPQIVISPWNEEVKDIETVYTDEPDYEPTPERPLVYHLFGHLNEPSSVVLTEDDYFKYLIGVTRNRKDVPTSVSYALTNAALLFLGFQLDDWNFRVLYQSLLAYGGGARRDDKTFAHIAAQIEPDEGRFIDPESARGYLESYFGTAHIYLFWGSPQDFVKELSQRVAVSI